MEEAPENDKESSNSAHANGMNVCMNIFFAVESQCIKFKIL